MKFSLAIATICAAKKNKYICRYRFGGFTQYF